MKVLTIFKFKTLVVSEMPKDGFSLLTFAPTERNQWLIETCLCLSSLHSS